MMRILNFTGLALMLLVMVQCAPVSDVVTLPEISMSKGRFQGVRDKLSSVKTPVPLRGLLSTYSEKEISELVDRDFSDSPLKNTFSLRNDFGTEGGHFIILIGLDATAKIDRGRFVSEITGKSSHGWKVEKIEVYKYESQGKLIKIN